MKHFSRYIVCCSLFVLSCDTEPFGPFRTDEEASNELIFQDQYYTGGDCTGGSPDYFVGSEILEGQEIPNTLPQNFDLSNFLPPVGNQGRQGSCVSWAVGYYMKSMQEKIEHDHSYSSETIMSPAYTYNQITRGNCTGTSVEATLSILQEKGISSLSTFPYNENDCATQPGMEQDEDAEKARIGSYKGLSGSNMVAEMKSLLLEQTPIIISTTLDNQFGVIDATNLTAYRPHNVVYANSRCHVMLVVGYSDTNTAFKVVNSWGTDWGDNGFVWIDYEAFENVTSNDAAFRVINGAYVAYDL